MPQLPYVPDFVKRFFVSPLSGEGLSLVQMCTLLIYSLHKMIERVLPMLKTISVKVNCLRDPFKVRTVFLLVPSIPELTQCDGCDYEYGHAAYKRCKELVKEMFMYGPLPEQPFYPRSPHEPL